MTVYSRIQTLFEQGGGDLYFGESITQSEHALQAAALAEAEGVPDSLVVAALLHDVGHLLDGDDETVADRGIDARHEDLGETWLQAYFDAEVTDPVNLHVAAKRYLCAVDPSYHAQLSPASQRSLALQGGPMSQEEVQQFETSPHYRAAVQLRIWDDRAKVVGLEVPGLDHYRSRIEALAK